MNYVTLDWDSPPELVCMLVSFVIVSSDTEDGATDGWQNRSAPMLISKDLGAAERVSEHET